MLSHVHDALRQVALIRNQLRDSSGGFVALAGAFLISELLPAQPQWHVAAWCLVGAISFAINYGSLVFYRERNGADLKHQAVTDPFVLLIISGAVTLGAIRTGAYALLYGIWMTFFGLMHLGARKSFARESAWLGWFYIFSGAVLLVFVSTPESFLNPWPMGLVFFTGEIAGGVIFARMKLEVDA